MKVNTSGNQEIKTVLFQSEFEVKENNKEGKIFVGIEGKEYSVIDMYVISEDE